MILGSIASIFFLAFVGWLAMWGVALVCVRGWVCVCARVCVFVRVCVCSADCWFVCWYVCFVDLFVLFCWSVLFVCLFFFVCFVLFVLFVLFVCCFVCLSFPHLYQPWLRHYIVDSNSKEITLLGLVVLQCFGLFC